MNKLYTFLIASIFSISGYAQTTVNIVTGAGYANDVYYSFDNGSVSTSPRAEWDIAFATGRYNVSVLANNGSMVELYTYPNGDISAWNSVDISDIESWPQMYNSVVHLYDGAFLQNAVQGDDFDYGWGRYNMGTHHIVGDSIYIIKTTAGNNKKLCIVEKNPNSGVNSWEIKYADTDGSNEHTVTISADPYSSKNYVYYSLENNQIIDREPASDEWELNFTKYFDYNIPYSVTGVLINSTRVTAHEVDAVSAATYETYDETLFNDSISIIGSDWKTFNMGTMSYDLDDDRVYFVKVMNEEGLDSNYWKMYFTGFSGSSDGTYTFVQKKIEAATSLNAINEIAMMEVYPNPATNQINVIYDSSDDVTISIFDLSGKIVYRKKYASHGFEKQIISVNNLKSGVYNIIVESVNSVSHTKLIKQ
ncbi:MAG: T9SS type A sorting domain-containing protein [Bacteroidota bacterium]|nr:T9SS type A sorting domain-containing protein [Bacteroidota bacterium]